MKKQIAFFLTIGIVFLTGCSVLTRNNSSPGDSVSTGGDESKIPFNKDLLGDVDIKDFLSIPVGEVIEILGDNHSETMFAEGNVSISYGDILFITYERTNEPLEYYTRELKPGEAPKVNWDAKVMAVCIYAEKDIYKGISVGKSLDELNKNLKNKLELEEASGDSSMVAYGVLQHNGNNILATLTFDERNVCEKVQLIYKEGEDLSGVTEI